MLPPFYLPPFLLSTARCLCALYYSYQEAENYLNYSENIRGASLVTATEVIVLFCHVLRGRYYQKHSDGKTN